MLRPTVSEEDQTSFGLRTQSSRDKQGNSAPTLSAGRLMAQREWQWLCACGRGGRIVCVGAGLALFRLFVCWICKQVSSPMHHTVRLLLETPVETSCRHDHCQIGVLLSNKMCETGDIVHFTTHVQRRCAQVSEREIRYGPGHMQSARTRRTLAGGSKPPETRIAATRMPLGLGGCESKIRAELFSF